jgi:hypothetical protein
LSVRTPVPVIKSRKLRPIGWHGLNYRRPGAKINIMRQKQNWI